MRIVGPPVLSLHPRTHGPGEDQFHVREIPFLEMPAQPGILLGHVFRSVPVQIDKNEAIPDLTPVGFQPPLITVESFGLLHFRTGFELAVELEGPRMVGTEQQSGVTATGLALPDLRRVVTIVAEAGRHDVHPPVGTDSGMNPDLAAFVPDDEERFTQQIDIEEITILRNLGDVTKGEPFLAKDRADFPIEKLLGSVCLRGQSDALLQRQIRRTGDLVKNRGDRHFGQGTPGATAMGKLERICGHLAGPADIGFGKSNHMERHDEIGKLGDTGRPATRQESMRAISAGSQQPKNTKEDTVIPSI